MIVQLLRDMQKTHGYLRDVDLEEIARVAKVPLNRVEEVASFYPHFQLWPPPDVVVQVCRDMACHLRGSRQLLKGLQLGKIEIEDVFTEQACPQSTGADELRRQPPLENKEAGENPPAYPRKGPVRQVRIEGVSCLGRCDRAPATCVTSHVAPAIHEHTYARRPGEDLPALRKRIVETLEQIGHGKKPAADTDEAYPAPVGWQSWKINVYGRQPELPRYAAVRRFMDECKEKLATEGLRLEGDSPRHFAPKSVVMRWLKKLEDSNLLGMGGAGVPAAVKWRGVYEAAKDIRYVVANGDESEPTTFKDRELLLRCPNLVVEGVILAGLLTGATRGYIYVRHEYHEQIEALREEIRSAEKLGKCGDNVFGTGRSMPVEVFVSPGGYICGEQSALLEAMEDRRSQPRNRPPDLLSNGLFDMPTSVNNVETLAWAPAIFLEADGWYKAPGWRLLSICGDVATPGVYEVEIGAPLKSLVDQAGGMLGGKPLLAFATSGPSGGFLPARLRFDPATLTEQLDHAKKEIRTQQFKDQLDAYADRHLRTSKDATVDVLTLPIDLNFFRAIGGVLGKTRNFGFGPIGLDLMLGAGLMVYAERNDAARNIDHVLDQAINATEFFRNESCGKCVPCRIGSEKLVQIGTSLRDKRRQQSGAGRLDEIAFQLDYVMNQTSICGLGQVVGRPLIFVESFFLSEKNGSAAKE